MEVRNLPKFLDQWRNITSNGFLLNMVNGHHLQLRHPPPLFHSFRLFSLKTTPAHHPVIQKQIDELLAKGTIESPTGGAGFYSSLLVFT